MRIAELAELAGVSVRTIRYYHQAGALPEPPRRANGYRDYSADDLVTALRARQLTGEGLSLAAAGALAAGPSPQADEEALEATDVPPAILLANLYRDHGPFFLLVEALVLSLEKPLTAILRKPGLWFVTVLVNQRIMTWFLWHLTVMVGLAHLLLALDARALLPEPLSGEWWATRPLWALVLLALTGLVMLAMSRFEEPRADDRPAPDLWKPMLAAVTVIARLVVMASVGVVGKSGVNWEWPLLPVVGM